jgi:hypothetical protein
MHAAHPLAHVSLLAWLQAASTMDGRGPTEPFRQHRAGLRPDFQFLCQFVRAPSLVSAACASRQAELEAELENEMTLFGVDPAIGRLTNSQHAALREEMECKREAAVCRRPFFERERVAYMRSTILHYLHKVGQLGPGTPLSRVMRR